MRMLKENKYLLKNKSEKIKVGGTGGTCITHQFVHKCCKTGL